MLTESEPHFRQPLLRTPFHERARAASQLDSFVPWSGYTTVDVFSTVEQEYFAIRNATSLYDLTPMVKYRIAGHGALPFLNRLMTRDLRKLAPGKVAYSVWCDDAGRLIDDGTVFCLAANEYRLCTAERQLDWLEASAIGFDVEIAEITEEVAALAVQGPTSCALLRALGLEGIERLRPFELGHFRLALHRPVAAPPIELMVSRTGFTGDLGYELWMRPADAENVWDALMEEGRGRGIRPIGSQALNIARIEAGFLLPHLDFVSAAQTLRIGTERSPLELGPRLAGRFREGAFHRPPRTVRRARPRGASPAGRARRRGQQAGSQRTAVRHPLRQDAGRQRQLCDLVADLQAQSRARHARRTALCRRRHRLGRDLSEPRAHLGAPHGAGTGGGAAFLCTATAACHAAGGFLRASRRS